MLRRFWSALPWLDWWLLTTVFLLVIFGLVMLGSIEYNLSGSLPGTFYKQLIYVGVGLIALIFSSLIDYRILRNYAYIFYLLSIILLVAVLIFGTTVRGTTGWFHFFGFSFQPVELVKIFFIIFLSYYFSQYREELFKFKKILLSAGFTGLLLGLVFLQPDLGSALIFLGVWLGLLFLTAPKKSHLLIMSSTLVLLAVGSWFLVLRDYQKERVLTFLDPQRDPLVTGYNLSQSLVAVGSGKLWGRGLGLGPQSQLDFLPEQENDFIFAAIGEELGFLGAGFIILLFGFIFYRIFKIIKRSPDTFSLLLASGFLLYLFVQTLINIGMNIGLLPITGLPLPFVSAGGSSLITLFIVIGILENIFLRTKKI